MKITATNPWGKTQQFESTRNFQQEILKYVQGVLRDLVEDLYGDPMNLERVDDIQKTSEKIKEIYKGFDETLDVAAEYGYTNFQANFGLNSNPDTIEF